MCPVLRLFIHLRIPIRIEYYHSIRHLQIQSVSTRASTQQKHLLFRVLLIEHLQVLCAVLVLSRAVQSQMLYALIVEEDLHNVH
jgi:hypothetical protein